MNEKAIQTQINELNQKLDVILEFVNQQKLKSDVVEDLIQDVSIVGKDVYDSTVAELENQAVEIDPEELKILGIKFLKNIENFSLMMNMFESVVDFIKDASPIANEMIIDFTKKLSEFENKGYFEFFGEAANIMDNIVTHYTKDDVKHLADNVVNMLDTVKSITQPDMLNSINNAVKVYNSMEMDNIPKYSIWKLMREIRKPEMKRSMGFMVTFLKNISNDNKSNN